MEIIYVERRLTHKYVGTWKHLDRHEFVGRVKLTPGRTLARRGDDQPDPSEGPVYIQFGRLPRGLSKRQKESFLEALESTLSAWGCSHEWDCCGCASYTARASLIRGRRFRICTRVTYNY